MRFMVRDEADLVVKSVRSDSISVPRDDASESTTVDAEAAISELANAISEVSETMTEEVELIMPIADPSMAYTLADEELSADAEEENAARLDSTTAASAAMLEEDELRAADDPLRAVI